MRGGGTAGGTPERRSATGRVLAVRSRQLRMGGATLLDRQRGLAEDGDRARVTDGRQERERGRVLIYSLP